MKKFVSIFILVCFLVTGQMGTYPVYAQEFSLPAPSVRVGLSPEFNPPILKGLKVHPDNPFRFDFILDQGDTPSLVKEGDRGSLKQEATKLIKYFLASLTIPEKDLWVNLSPYEKDRIIPNSFGLTEMGRDLLAEDYMLKQITASLIYPEDEIGKKFWKRIYEEAYKKFGTTNIPVNTFNKVWIVPEKAVVYENTKAGTAYIVESKLKVMLEQDYLALSRTVIPAKAGIQETSTLGSQIVREIVIPELIKEVNEGKNFVQLRQVYNSLILATWYKKKIKDSILAQVYADKSKIAGIVSLRGSETTEAIYQRYLQAFKKGAYNYIKEEQDPTTQQTIPRKYFSGGMTLDMAMMESTQSLPQGLDVPKKLLEIKANLASLPGKTWNGRSQDAAMMSMVGSKYISHLANHKANRQRLNSILEALDRQKTILFTEGYSKELQQVLREITAWEMYLFDYMPGPHDRIDFETIGTKPMSDIFLLFFAQGYVDDNTISHPVIYLKKDYLLDGEGLRDYFAGGFPVYAEEIRHSVESLWRNRIYMFTGTQQERINNGDMSVGQWPREDFYQATYVPYIIYEANAKLRDAWFSGHLSDSQRDGWLSREMSDKYSLPKSLYLDPYVKAGIQTSHQTDPHKPADFVYQIILNKIREWGLTEATIPKFLKRLNQFFILNEPRRTTPVPSEAVLLWQKIHRFSFHSRVSGLSQTELLRDFDERYELLLKVSNELYALLSREGLINEEKPKIEEILAKLNKIKLSMPQEPTIAQIDSSRWAVQEQLYLLTAYMGKVLNRGSAFHNILDQMEEFKSLDDFYKALRRQIGLTQTHVYSDKLPDNGSIWLLNNLSAAINEDAADAAMNSNIRWDEKNIRVDRAMESDKVLYNGKFNVRYLTSQDEDRFFASFSGEVLDGFIEEIMGPEIYDKNIQGIFNALRNYWPRLKVPYNSFDIWKGGVEEMISHVLFNALDAEYESRDRLIDQKKRSRRNGAFSVGIKILLKGNQIIISINDYGEGISKGVLNHWKAEREPSISTKEGKFFIGGWGEGISEFLRMVHAIEGEVQFHTFNKGQGWIFRQDEIGRRSLTKSTQRKKGTTVQIFIPLEAKRKKRVKDPAMIITPTTSKRVLEVTDDNGKTHYVKGYLDEKEADIEFLFYKIAKALNVHMPEVILLPTEKAVDLMKAFEIRLHLKPEVFLITQSAEEYYRGLDKPHSGLEELIAFCYLVDHRDIHLGIYNNIFHKNGVFIAYDPIDSITSLESVLERFADVLDQVDPDKFISAVQASEQLSLDQFSGFSSLLLDFVRERQKKMRLELISNLNDAQKHPDKFNRDLVRELKRRLEVYPEKLGDVAMSKEYFQRSKLLDDIKPGKVYEYQGPDGKVFFIEFKNVDREVIVHMAAAFVGVNSPKSIKIGREMINALPNFKELPAGQKALVLQSAAEMQDEDLRSGEFSGIEEASIFTQLMGHWNWKVAYSPESEGRNSFMKIIAGRSRYILIDFEDFGRLSHSPGEYAQIWINNILDLDIKHFSEVLKRVEEDKNGFESLLTASRSVLKDDEVEKLRDSYVHLRRNILDGLKDVKSTREQNDLSSYYWGDRKTEKQAKLQQLITVLDQDTAMKASPTGGIDLTPANMNLQTKVDSRFRGNDNGGIKFRLDPAMLAQLQNAPGFVPVIIDIQPMTSLNRFLGIAEKSGISQGVG